ncbi:MAG: serine dehydratase subunit alpha family protein, partial [Aeromonas veronii]
FATQVEFEQIKFILKASELNGKLSAEGMNNPYGLEIGRTMQQNINAGLIGEDVMNRIVMMTAAASDARMGGATLPAMSNFGSGNQGIAATIPVMVIAERFAASEEQLARALIMSHLGAIYIKSHYPPLSAFCGNTVTSAAASMAMVYLAGGSFEQSCFAIQNVLSDSAGMVCDGAKASCAMKVSTSSGAAVRGFLMALNSHSVSGQGIVAGDVDQTIRNVGQMVKEGMSATDSTIIDIMSA